MKLNKSKKGFTIVELVIVIGVIGILSAILIPTFVNLTDKAKDAAMKEECAQAYSAYAAEAADGIVDKTSDPITFLKQEEVILFKDGATYQFDGGWSKDETPATLTGLKTVVKDNNDLSTFNTYLVYANPSA